MKYEFRSELFALFGKLNRTELDRNESVSAEKRVNVLHVIINKKRKE